MVTPLAPGLYIVATPIGNLGDLSPRAAAILSAVDMIAVEDSRVTAKLLQHIGIKRPMLPYHDHNADKVRPGLIERMATEAIALVSDAGTPLISDPGYKLVRDARAAGRHIVTIPGPSAVIAALTLSGLPTDRFFFAGFLPAKTKARRDNVAQLARLQATLVFYESGPRLAAMLADLAAELGDRDAAVAREITKAYEECVTGNLEALSARYADAPPRVRLS
jgi:16S rRNA (cytidine1402-2'-O)-methyltransferase